MKKQIPEFHKYMVSLHKKNRFEFEKERTRLTKELINSAPEEYRPRLLKIQEDWDNKMEHAGSKENRLVLAETMLMDNFHNIFNPTL